MKQINKKKRSQTSPSEITRALGLTKKLGDYAVSCSGVTVNDTICSQKIDALDFATRLEALLAKPGFSEKLGLISLRQLSLRMVSPPELVIAAGEIGFVTPVMLCGIPFWQLARINSLFDRCGSKWKTVRQLALEMSLTIPQLSLLVIEGRLPKITASFFVPGWPEADLKLFLSRGDRFGIDEAGQYDIENGRIYPILDAPEPLRALDKTAAIQAFFGPLGHPVQLDDERYGWVAEHLDEIRFRPNKSAEPVEGTDNRRAGHVKKIKPRPRKSGGFVEVTDEMLIGLLEHAHK